MNKKEFVYFLFAIILAEFEFGRNFLPQDKITNDCPDGLRLVCESQKEDESYLQQYWIRIQNSISSNDGLIYYC